MNTARPKTLAVARERPVGPDRAWEVASWELSALMRAVVRQPRWWVAMICFTLVVQGIAIVDSSIGASDLNPSGPGDEPVGLGQSTPPPLIAFDAASSGQKNNSSTLTFAHTVGDFPNRVLVVGVEAEDLSATDCVVSGVTYNGAALTRGGQSTAGTVEYVCVELWYLSAPVVTTADIIVTWTNKVGRGTAGATGIYHAAQQAPVAIATQALDSASSINTSVSTLTDSSWVIDAVGSGNNNVLTLGEAQQVQRYQENTPFELAGAGSTRLVGLPASTPMSWTQSATSPIAHVLAVFEQAP